MKKIVLSLLLTFALIPLIPSGTTSAASATSIETITYYNGAEPIELSPAEKEIKFATCIAKAEKVELIGPLNSNYYEFGIKFESDDSVEPVSVNGGYERLGDEFYFSHPLLGSKKGKESFYIQRPGTSPISVSPPIKIKFWLENGGCYNCTFLDGSNKYAGNCGPVAPPSKPDTPGTPDTCICDGASRVLAPLSALFGALLLLF